LWIDREWAKQVVHIGSYISLLQRMKPDSIPRMAAFISIMRPGKAHLQDQTWDKVFAEVWDGDSSEGYTFKKSHSIGYSMLVALHMNLLSEQQAHDSV
jgi:DNA polymerase III alpha subunit